MSDTLYYFEDTSYSSSNYTNKLSIPFTNKIINNRSISSKLDDNNKIVIFFTSTNVDRDEKLKHMHEDIKYKVNKRKEDIFILERDLQKLTLDIKSNFQNLDETDENSKSKDMYLLLSQIGNHNKQIDELTNKSNFTYTKQDIITSITLEPNILNTVKDIFDKPINFFYFTNTNITTSIKDIKSTTYTEDFEYENININLNLNPNKKSSIYINDDEYDIKSKPYDKLTGSYDTYTVGQTVYAKFKDVYYQAVIVTIAETICEHRYPSIFLLDIDGYPKLVEKKEFEIETSIDDLKGCKWYSKCNGYIDGIDKEPEVEYYPKISCNKKSSKNSCKSRCRKRSSKGSRKRN